IGLGGGADQRLGHGGAGGGPPLIGVLLSPGRVRVVRVERGDAEAAASAGRVEQSGADALRADVEAEIKRRGVHGGEEGQKKTGRRGAPCRDEHELREGQSGSYNWSDFYWGFVSVPYWLMGRFTSGGAVAGDAGAPRPTFGAGAAGGAAS